MTEISEAPKLTEFAFAQRMRELREREKAADRHWRQASLTAAFNDEAAPIQREASLALDDIREQIKALEAARDEQHRQDREAETAAHYARWQASADKIERDTQASMEKAATLLEPVFAALTEAEKLFCSTYVGVQASLRDHKLPALQTPSGLAGEANRAINGPAAARMDSAGRALVAARELLGMFGVLHHDGAAAIREMEPLERPAPIEEAA